MIKVNHQASSVARGFFSRLLEGVSVYFGLGGAARTAATRPRATIQVSALMMWGAMAVSPTVFFRHVVHEVVRMSAYLVSGSAAAVWPMACWQSLLAEQPIGSRGICAATKNQRPRRLSYGQQRGYVVAIMHKRKAYSGPRSSLADSGSSTFSARSMRARPHSSGCRCPPAISPRSPCGAPPTYAARSARNGDNGQ